VEFKEIKFAVKDAIATMTLDRPDIRNAITSSEMITEIETVCERAIDDMAIKVLIITGTDPAFSSGGNIKDMAARKGMFAGPPARIMENYRRNIQRIPVAIYNVGVPTIAAVNGPAIGAGCDLALMCDMRLASTKAKFGETFLNVGLIPGDGGAFFLPRAVGMARACELTFTGEILNAYRALEIGLINYVCEHEDLMTQTYALAGKIKSKPPQALRMAKKLLYAGQRMGLSELLEHSAACQALCHHTTDHYTALSAVFSKQEPQFSGE